MRSWRNSGSGLTYGEWLLQERARREANKKAKEQRKIEADKSPIRAAILPLKEIAIDRAIEYANETVRKVVDDLTFHNWDINAAAPYPKTAWTADYYRALNKYRLYTSLVTYTNPTIRQSAPNYVSMNTEYIDRFIRDAKENAAIEFDKYVLKLVSKIGTVLEAKLQQGSGALWYYSVLTIVKPTGEIQNWKTQMIHNVSKYGKVFSQFPTREVKP